MTLSLSRPWLKTRTKSTRLPPLISPRTSRTHLTTSLIIVTGTACRKSPRSSVSAPQEPASKLTPRRQGIQILWSVCRRTRSTSVVRRPLPCQLQWRKKKLSMSRYRYPLPHEAKCRHVSLHGSRIKHPHRPRQVPPQQRSPRRQVVQVARRRVHPSPRVVKVRASLRRKASPPGNEN